MQCLLSHKSCILDMKHPHSSLCSGECWQWRMVLHVQQAFKGYFIKKWMSDQSLIGSPLPPLLQQKVHPTYNLQSTSNVPPPFWTLHQGTKLVHISLLQDHQKTSWLSSGAVAPGCSQMKFLDSWHLHIRKIRLLLGLLRVLLSLNKQDLLLKIRAPTTLFMNSL